MQWQTFAWVLLVAVLLVSSFILHFLQGLSFTIIRPFSLETYRKFNYYVAFIIYSFGTFGLKNISNCNFKLYMSDEDRKKFNKEHKLVIINHTVEFDFLLPIIFHDYLGGLGGVKTFSKISSRCLPVFGWTGFFTDFIFLHRNYTKDAAIIQEGMPKLLSYPKRFWNSLYLPAEGTRFNKEKHEQSIEIAKQKGLPPLRHHLLPRTKGFCCAVQSSGGKLNAVYDITYVAVGKTKVTLMNVFKGHEFTFHARIQRIDIKEIPEPENKMAEWLHELYQKKDQQVDKFLTDHTFDLPYQNFKSTLADSMIVTVASLLVFPLLSYLLWSILVGSTSLKIVILFAIVSLSWLFKTMMDRVNIKHATTFSNHNNNQDSLKIA